VSTHPLDVATLAAYYAIADSNGTAGVIIYTDSQYRIALDKAEKIRAIIEQHRGCRVLDFVDTPIGTAAELMPSLVAAELREFGPALTHLLAVNGNYFTGSRLALLDAGLRGTDPPHAIAAGDGDAAEFQRIRDHDYQAASVAEPLYLQGWQLVDELNRALAGEGVSGYLAPPSLVTTTNVPSGSVFDPVSGYRDQYRRTWHPQAV
jgi:ribose transport system substrate-binding protein